MTIIYIIIASVVVLAGLIWLARRDAASNAVGEYELDQARKDAANARKQGDIIAEHRDRGDVTERMRDGSF